MGRKKSVASFLCGVIFRRKRPPAVKDEDEDPKYEARSAPTTSGRSPENAPEPSEPVQPEPEPEPVQPLPPPPGNGKFHKRTYSCGPPRRSHSSVSKLMSSMSFKIGGGRGGSVSSSFASASSLPGQEDRPRHKEKGIKYFKHEDSVWKKTIILGERNRVPDEEDDDISLYDEKGNKITPYHPKTYSGLLKQNSRQSTFSGHEE